MAETDSRKGPEYYADLARAAMEKEKWLAAAEFWLKAAGASIGESRADRYWKARRDCLLKAKAAVFNSRPVKPPDDPERK